MARRGSNRIPLIATGLLAWAALSAEAQVTVPVPNQGTGPVAVSSTSNEVWINAGIFVALTGAALFAICRGSRRV